MSFDWNYLYVFVMVFAAIGLKSFQQRVMMSDRYPLMGMIAGVIYAMEVSAVVVVSTKGINYIVSGLLAASLAVPFGVYMYNHVFNKRRGTQHEQLRNNGDGG